MKRSPYETGVQASTEWGKLKAMSFKDSHSQIKYPRNKKKKVLSEKNNIHC